MHLLLEELERRISIEDLLLNIADERKIRSAMRHLDTLFVPKFASIKDWFFSEELAAGRLCEELHELMLESEHPAFVLDVDERFVALNEKWKGLCGFTPSEVLLKSPKELLQGKKSDSAKAQAFAKEIRRDGTAKTTLVYYRKDGEVLVLQLTATRVTDLSGSVFVFTVGREASAQPKTTPTGRFLRCACNAVRL